MERTTCLPGQARSRDGSTCVQACDRGQIFLLDHEGEGQPILASAVAQTGRLSNKCFPTYTAFESYGRLQGYRPGSLPEQNPNRTTSLIESVNRHNSINATYLQAFAAMSRAIDEGMNSGPNATTLGTTTRDDSMISLPLYGESPSGI